MAGTATFTESANITPIRTVKVVWVSSTGGAADGTSSFRYTGAVVDFINTNGTTPSASYDVVVNDADGNDVLNGLGANLSESATTHKTLKDGLGYVNDSALTLGVTNAGDTKGGTIWLKILS